MLAEQETDNADIFNQTFLQQLCTRFFEKELRSKANPIQGPHLDLYLQIHPLTDDVREILRDFLKRGRDAMCQEASTAVHEHVSEGFEGRAKSHIRCAVEKTLKQFRGHSSVPVSILKRLRGLTSIVFFVCSLSASNALSEADEGTIKDFCLLKWGSSENQYDLAAWKPPILTVVHRFRQLFAPLRRPLPPEELGGCAREAANTSV